MRSQGPSPKALASIDRRHDHKNMAAQMGRPFVIIQFEAFPVNRVNWKCSSQALTLVETYLNVRSGGGLDYAIRSTRYSGRDFAQAVFRQPFIPIRPP